MENSSLENLSNYPFETLVDVVFKENKKLVEELKMLREDILLVLQLQSDMHLEIKAIKEHLEIQ
jgi:formate-dependent nitrite reductase cytochrome c552 subunit